MGEKFHRAAGKQPRRGQTWQYPSMDPTENVHRIELIMEEWGWVMLFDSITEWAIHRKRLLRELYAAMKPESQRSEAGAEVKADVRAMVVLAAETPKLVRAALKKMGPGYEP